MFFHVEERTDTIFFSSAHCTRRRVGDVGDESLESLKETKESEADAGEVGSVAFGEEEVGSGVTHRSTSETFVKSRRSLKVCIRKARIRNAWVCFVGSDDRI